MSLWACGFESRPRHQLNGWGFFCPNDGDVAEWLGRGLQILVRRFESARRLQTGLHGPLT